MVIVRTERLTLRDFRDGDWQAVHTYSSDSEVVRYMDWGPNTKADTKRFIRRAKAHQKEKPRRNFTLAVILKAERKLIGSCGIHVWNPDNREGWIGYCFNRNSWRNGFATEAAEALLDFGFGRLGLHRIFATCDPANVASAHVLQKIGMKIEGHLREHKWAKGDWQDSLLFSILEQEWKKPSFRKNTLN